MRVVLYNSSTPRVPIIRANRYHDPPNIHFTSTTLENNQTCSQNYREIQLDNESICKKKKKKKKKLPVLVRIGYRFNTANHLPFLKDNTQTSFASPSASPLFTVFPVFLITARTVSYETLGSVDTSAVWFSRLTSNDLTPVPSQLYHPACIDR